MFFGWQNRDHSPNRNRYCHEMTEENCFYLDLFLCLVFPVTVLKAPHFPSLGHRKFCLIISSISLYSAITVWCMDYRRKRRRFQWLTFFFLLSIFSRRFLDAGFPVSTGRKWRRLTWRQWWESTMTGTVRWLFNICLWHSKNALFRKDSKANLTYGTSNKSPLGWALKKIEEIKVLG